MTRAVSTLTSSRHPATWGAFAAALLAGCWGLFLPDGQSNALDDALPTWFSGIYYAGMGLSGLCGLIALSVDNQERRILGERCAWYGVGWFALFYACAAFASVGMRGGQAAILVGAYSPVATARIVQITRQRRRANRDMERGLPADPPAVGVAEDDPA